MPAEKLCSWCREPFTPVGRRIFCNDDCRAEGHNQSAGERRALEQAQEPPPSPSPGRFGSVALARSALLEALRREGGWWGEPMVGRWAQAHQVDQALGPQLLDALVRLGLVQRVGGGLDPVRWRVRRPS